MVGWLIGRLVGWVVGWLVAGWLARWVVGWLVGWLAGCLVGCLLACLRACKGGKPAGDDSTCSCLLLVALGILPFPLLLISYLTALAAAFACHLFAAPLTGCLWLLPNTPKPSDLDSINDHAPRLQPPARSQARSPEAPQTNATGQMDSWESPAAKNLCSDHHLHGCLCTTAQLPKIIDFPKFRRQDKCH